MNGTFADKAARLVDRGDAIELEGEPRRFVSRGGEKLARALEDFGIDPSGFRCLDAGASTGGFTDCLLQSGATTVVAVDVGYGQLHESLVSDSRVQNLERTNVRHLSVDDIGGPVDLVVGDLSFISLRKVLGALVALACVGADLALLIKPQFEAGRREASKGKGVIRDKGVWERVIDEVLAEAELVGAPAQNLTVSPIRGGEGNVEFLVHLRVGAEPKPIDVGSVLAGVDT